MRDNVWPNRYLEEKRDNRENDPRKDLHVLVVGSVFSENVSKRRTWKRYSHVVASETNPICTSLRCRMVSEFFLIHCTVPDGSSYLHLA
jgi:hypothetical protein